MKNDSFIIQGGNKLFGDIVNQTSKNATLPIMSACILCKEEITIYNYPKISDVKHMLSILKKLGAVVRIEENNLYINCKNINSSNIDCKLSKTMRSSVFLLGSLLGRTKKVILTQPGGCDIGKRPIDIHINSLKKLNVSVSFIDEYILFDATNAKPNKIKFKLPSVGATENLVEFCATLKGKSVIYNAAREPEVIDLCNFLNKMGAKILGAGTSKITIYGVDKLNGVTYKPMGDRIVSGTIACAVAVCGGDVIVHNASPYTNLKLIENLCSMGCQIDIKNDIMHIVQNNSLKSIKQIETGFYPNFATDLQSLILTTSCLAEGRTKVVENVFENRFLTLTELNKMGADIKQINNKVVEVTGVKRLVGASVQAKDLRGGAALVIAGLVASGEAVVRNVHFIDRGYEKLEEIFSSLGANIIRK